MIKQKSISALTDVVHFDEASVRKWFDAGTFALGIGSSVFTKDRVSKRDYISIEGEMRRVREY